MTGLDGDLVKYRISVNYCIVSDQTFAVSLSGAQCVLVLLWSVPDEALEIFYQTFYKSLENGNQVAGAVSEGMKALGRNKRFVPFVPYYQWCTTDHGVWQIIVFKKTV